MSKTLYDAAWARAQNKTTGRVLLPQAEELTRISPRDSPDAARHILVGSRPVKLVSTADGGLEVLAWSWSERLLVRDMSMLVVAIHHEEGDVTAVSEEEFNLRISSL